MNEKDAFFDLLICLDVFEHVDDYLGFFRGLKHQEIKLLHLDLPLLFYCEFHVQYNEELMVSSTKD